MSVLWRARRVAWVQANDGESPTGQTKTRHTVAPYDDVLARFRPKVWSQRATEHQLGTNRTTSGTKAAATARSRQLSGLRPSAGPTQRPGSGSDPRFQDLRWYRLGPEERIASRWVAEP